MTSKTDLVKQLNDITECPICNLTFTNPKILPCIHTFCLECLDTCARNKRAGQQLPCPVCRTLFTIPTGGVTNMPHNFFMAKLLDISQASKGGGSSIKCDNCDGEDEPAKWHCSDCSENLCGQCGNIHQIQRATKSHKVKLIDNQPVEELLKSRPSYCAQHTDKRIELYCTNCRKVICLLCFAEEHNSHKCVNINKMSDDFRQQLQTDDETIQKKIILGHQINKNMDIEKVKFISQYSSIKQEVNNRSEELKQLVDNHTSPLLQELVLLRDEAVKELVKVKLEVSSQLAILESFHNYSTKLKEKATPTELSSVADQMHDRANELGASPFRWYSPGTFQFNPPNLSGGFYDERCTSNIIGKIDIQGSQVMSETVQEMNTVEITCINCGQRESYPRQQCEHCGSYINTDRQVTMNEQQLRQNISRGHFHKFMPGNIQLTCQNCNTTEIYEKQLCSHCGSYTN